MRAFSPLLLAGCGVEAGPWFVAPHDGATGVALDAPLQVHLGDLAWPDDAPIPADTLVVVGLDLGGPVYGTARWSDGDVLFEPLEPWAPDRRYAWAVQEPVPEARQPVLRVPVGVRGEAVFDTHREVVLLEASVDDGQLCLLFSGAFETSRLDLTIDGVWMENLTVEPGALALGAIDRLAVVGAPATAFCLDPGVAADAATVRWTSASDVVSVVEVGAGRLSDKLLARHRWGEP